jgi:Rv0078B-related antitoxin
MSGEQRLLIALEMSLFARELTSARIRQEHPQWSEAQVAGEILRLAFLRFPLSTRMR